MSSNPLISTTKAPVSGLRAALHPLVLLTISDYITRHTLRRQTQPIAGALIGQQNGREITIEHAYDVKLKPESTPFGVSEWKVDPDWFRDRLQQYKDVHKEPALDLVGWWTISPKSGPGPEAINIHNYIAKTYETAQVLLTFHPESALDRASAGGKLPLTIYEGVYEGFKAADLDGDDAMQIENEGKEVDGTPELQFRELDYEIATGEAEMISVDFVARGGGNATAVDTGSKSGQAGEPSSKTQAKEVTPKKSSGATTPAPVGAQLNPEEEELIMFLNTRANAIKILLSRITLLKEYLTSLPPSYLSASSLEEAPTPNSDQNISYPILRAILALTARLPLLVPGDSDAFAQEQQAERSDVALVGLLGGIGKSIEETRDLGNKFGLVDTTKRERSKAHMGAAHWGAFPGAEELITEDAYGHDAEWETGGIF